MTDFLERYLTANAYGRELIVNEMDAEITTLRTLASSRAGDYATLLAENAALRAECEAAADYIEYLHCMFIENDYTYPSQYDAWHQARAARLTRADGDG